MNSLIALDVRLAGQEQTGDSTYWLGLLSGLAECDSEFDFLLLSNGSRPPEIPDSPRFRWQTVPGRHQRYWSLMQLPKAACRAGAVLVHTQYFLSPLIQGSAVTTIHDVSFMIGPQWFRSKDRALLRATIPGSARRASKVITVSETSRLDIEKYVPTAFGKTIATPLAAHPGLPIIDRATAKEFVQSAFGVTRPFVLTVGTRWPRKNMELAIAASELLPDSLPHQLVVTGKPGWGDQAPGSRTIATGYVDLQLLGCLYAAADLYLAPSHYEGFGLPLVEAFSCGCPVLCSNGGSLPEVAGDAAYVEKSWSASNWADSMTSLLSDSSKLEAMRQRGFQRAREFSWKLTAQKTLDVYREALR